MFKEFREFALRGNVVDMAVGLIIGAAFGAIIGSLVADVLMPPLGWIMGGVDFSNLFLIIKDGSMPGPYASLAEAQKAGAVSINYGVFINTLINFAIVALAMFLLIRAMNHLRRPEPAAAPPTKECPYCFSSMPVMATRCSQCTSPIKLKKQK